MKKLTLELDALEVESFEVTDDRGPAGGTVHGRDLSEYAYSCSGCGCEFSVGNSCYCTAGGWSCADYDTCGSPCALSVMTNCHRCTFDQSAVCTG